MNCEPRVKPELAEAIQTVEDHLRAQKESIMQDLESQVIAALMSGIPLRDLKIVEVTTWHSQSDRKANYKCVVQRKEESE